MSIKTTINHSLNFNLKKRKKSEIKFLIFHYTGMKSEKLAIQKLLGIQSEVSTHYFIKNDGKILLMVPDLYIAWHAGISQWKKFVSLNNKSIGIEISNPGHKNGYKNYNKKQINSLIKLSSFLIKKYKINKYFILGHSDVALERKKDPGELFPWRLLYKKKIGIWHTLKETKLTKFRMKKLNTSEKRIFISYLKKIGYQSKRKLCKNYKIFEKLLIKAFQRRFRPSLINGISDKECLFISKNLIKS
tara:strand:+ start:337 stop:1074 length:738 start_codon:yes stop_codon:yes gene_type:complete